MDDASLILMTAFQRFLLDLDLIGSIFSQFDLIQTEMIIHISNQTFACYAYGIMAAADTAIDVNIICIVNIMATTYILYRRPSRAQLGRFVMDSIQTMNGS